MTRYYFLMKMKYLQIDFNENQNDVLAIYAATHESPKKRRKTAHTPSSPKSSESNAFDLLPIKDAIKRKLSLRQRRERKLSRSLRYSANFLDQIITIPKHRTVYLCKYVCLK